MLPLKTGVKLTRGVYITRRPQVASGCGTTHLLLVLSTAATPTGIMVSRRLRLVMLRLIVVMTLMVCLLVVVLLVCPGAVMFSGLVLRGWEG